MGWAGAYWHLHVACWRFGYCKCLCTADSEENECAALVRIGACFRWKTKNARNEPFSASKTYRTNSDAPGQICAKAMLQILKRFQVLNVVVPCGSSQTAPLWNLKFSRACAPSELTPDSIAALASSFTTPISLEGNNCGSNLSNICCYHLLPTWLSMVQGIVCSQGTVPTPPSTVEMLVAAPTGNCCDSALPSLENSAEANANDSKKVNNPTAKCELTGPFLEPNWQWPLRPVIG